MFAARLRGNGRVDLIIKSDSVICDGVGFRHWFSDVKAEDVCKEACRYAAALSTIVLESTGNPLA